MKRCLSTRGESICTRFPIWLWIIGSAGQTSGDPMNKSALGNAFKDIQTWKLNEWKSLRDICINRTINIPLVR